MEIDYKKILDSVFENANCDELGCILRNEDVPFEYCMRAMKMKGIGWQNKLCIAKRRDCPADVVLKLCKGSGEKFTKELLGRGYGVPEDALRELFKKDINLEPIMQYWTLPDDIRREIFKKIGNKWNSILVDFIDSQCSIPDDCRHYLDVALERVKKSGDMWDREHLIPRVKRSIALLAQPIDEDVAIGEIDSPKITSRRSVFKIAANPSISDYLIMELRLKVPEDDRELVEMLLAKNEQSREEYRSRQ